MCENIKGTLPSASLGCVGYSGVGRSCGGRTDFSTSRIQTAGENESGNEKKTKVKLLR